MRSLIDSLGEYPMAMLRGIAELHGVALASNARDEAAAQLAALLTQPGAVEAALALRSPAAQAAWRDLSSHGALVKVPAFARTYGALRPVGPGKIEREAIWRQPANPAEELWYAGLIYRSFADLGGGPAEYFFIPEELRPPVPAATAGQPPAAALPGAPAPVARGQAPRSVRRAFNSLAVDLCTTLAELTETPWHVAHNGEWRAADEARVRELLVLRDPIRFALLVTLGRDLGWLEDERGRLMVRGQALGSWLHDNAWDQRSALYCAWRDSTAWNDLRRLPSLRAEGEWRNDPVAARRAVLLAMSGLEPDAWYAIADFVAWIKNVNPDFQRPEGNYQGWYLRDRASDRYLSGFESWDDVEGRLIYFLITEPLFWLAAVDLGVTAEDGREVFRLSPAGRAWIAGQEPPDPPRPARLEIDDEFLVTAPPGVPLLDRFRLVRLTEPVVGPVEPGQPTRHRITRRSLSRARAAGLSVDKILQFLRHATGSRLPQRVELGLQRWEQHGGPVRVSRGAVLRVEDASVLAVLRADPAVAPLLGELISAQAVLVSTANLPRLLAALAELGYAPRVEDA